MAKGTIKWYSKEQGFGFIMPDDGGRDIYLLTSNVETPDQYLADGQRVEYEMKMGRKGPEAIHVRPIE